MSEHDIVDLGTERYRRRSNALAPHTFAEMVQLVRGGLAELGDATDNGLLYADAEAVNRAAADVRAGISLLEHRLRKFGVAFPDEA